MNMTLSEKDVLVKHVNEFKSLLRTLSEKNPSNHVLSRILTQLDERVTEFESTLDLNVYRLPHSYSKFKGEVKKIFKSEDSVNIQNAVPTQNADSWMHSLHQVLINVFNAFFSLYDFVVTSITNKPVSRSFFDLPLSNSNQFVKLEKDFNAAFEALYNETEKLSENYLLSPVQ